jgi:hypothetical protein
MSMDARDWAGLASVYRAGAERSRGWPFNADRQQDAEVLEAQADRCDEIARDQDGNPPVTHSHQHTHHTPSGNVTHQHRHHHRQDETAHDHEYTPGELSRLWPGEAERS